LKTSNFEYPCYNISDSSFPTHRCIGNNARRTLVLAEQKDFEEHGVLLTKILRAVELDFNQDVSFISMESGESLNLLSTSSAKDYDNLLLFGINPRQIGLMTNARLSLLRLEEHTVIASTQLSTIATDPKAKRILWDHLKEVFNDKT